MGDVNLGPLEKAGWRVGPSGDVGFGCDEGGGGEDDGCGRLAELLVGRRRIGADLAASGLWRGMARWSIPPPVRARACAFGNRQGGGRRGGSHLEARWREGPSAPRAAGREGGTADVLQTREDHGLLSL